MSRSVTSDWHLNADGLWENAAGWVIRRAHAATVAHGIVYVGYRPACDGTNGEKVDGKWVHGWGETWAWSLDDCMQRVDRTSGAWHRIVEVRGPVDAARRALRAEAVTQMELGLGWEAA